MAENADFTPPADPWALFREWYALAEQNEPIDPNAMSLATMGDDGMPSVRIVLLKGFEAGRFSFFTNRQSHKGEQLKAHPKAALCFYWKSLKRQIRVEGMVAEANNTESDAYFASRPRGSQIGAWASQQSKLLQDRATLQQRVTDLEKQYEGKSVPRPPHWGGYNLTPLIIEFWQDRLFRLHDRILYRRANEQDAWTIERLYP